MAKKKRTAQTFPQSIYVSRHQSEGYLLAHDTASDPLLMAVDGGELIAEYRLVSVKKKVVDHRLEPA